jgi:hypothetical protein
VMGGSHLAATLQLSFLLELVAECHDSWQHDTIGVLPVATQTTTPHLISTELVLSLSISLIFLYVSTSSRALCSSPR